MQFSAIIVAAFAAVAIAAPYESTSAPTCSNGQSAKCCNSLVPQLLGGVIAQVGLGCVNLIGTCSQTAACCSQKSVSSRLYVL